MNRAGAVLQYCQRLTIRTLGKSMDMAIDTHAIELKFVRRDDSVALDLRPLQGLWTEAQYLRLTNQTNNLIEFTDGTIEVLPMPTRSHQLIVRWLFLAFYAWLQPRNGLVLFAPLRVQIRPGKQREPDIVLLLDATDPRNQEAYWLGADLVVEVVSPDDPERDTHVKRSDYAEAGIPEYWIVNPIEEAVTVLTLRDDQYTTYGSYGRGERAYSRLLAGFSISVDETFDVG